MLYSYISFPSNSVPYNTAKVESFGAWRDGLEVQNACYVNMKTRFQMTASRKQDGYAHKHIHYFHSTEDVMTSILAGNKHTYINTKTKHRVLASGRDSTSKEQLMKGNTNCSSGHLTFTGTHVCTHTHTRSHTIHTYTTQPHIQ